MHWIDLTVVVICLVGITIYGSLFAKKAGKNTGEFILGGRKMPWWLAGASMIATGFNASTPLSDSRKMREDGFSGLWFAWQGIIVSNISTIFFSRLWRRSRLTTAVEFYDIRYSGKAARFARTYDVGILGIVNGCIWSAIGLVAMKKIAQVMFGLPEYFAIAGMNVPSDWVVVICTVALAIFYASASGVYGVVWTDLVELIIAVGASYYLFFHVFQEVGWNVGLREKVLSLDNGKELLHMLPELGPALVVLWFVQPLISLGNINPGVQRMLTVKNEKEVLKTHYFSSVANWVIKPWPFLIAGLASIFIISDTSLLENWPTAVSTSGEVTPDYEMVYPQLVTQYLPVGLVGLMVASFLFAFMSSLDTNIHISGSIFVNDLYRPYLAKGKSPEHYVNVTRLFMVVLTISSILVAIFFDNILMLLIFALTIHNSSGIIKPLRWLWWRASGMAEIYGQLTGLAMTILIFFTPLGEAWVQWVGERFNTSTNDSFYAIRLMTIVIASSTMSLLAIAIHGPEPREKIDAFYRRIRPYGFWGPVAESNPEFRHKDSMLLLWSLTIASFGLLFGAIFSCVGFFLALWPMMFTALTITIVSAVLVYRFVNKLYPRGQEIAEDNSYGE